MLNETMNLNRSNITNVEPSRIEPTSRIEQPSYFNARESIIPKLPDTPKPTQPERIIKPSPKIETKKLPISIESPKIEVKPADVAPPKIDKVSQFSSSILDDAINEIEKEDRASTLIGSAFRGHKGRSDYNYIKEYPKIAAKRLEEIKKMTPNDDITRKTTKREDKPTNVETQKEKNIKKFDEVLSQNPIRHDSKNVKQKKRRPACLPFAIANFPQQLRKRCVVAFKHVERWHAAVRFIVALVLEHKRNLSRYVGLHPCRSSCNQVCADVETACIGGERISEGMSGEYGGRRAQS